MCAERQEAKTKIDRLIDAVERLIEAMQHKAPINQDNRL